MYLAPLVVAACTLACASEPLPAPQFFGPNRIVFDDPSGVLQPYQSTIRATLDSTLQKAQAKLSISGVTITVGADASQTIAGYGAGGYTPDATHVLLHLDLSFPNLDEVLHRKLPLLAAHELHHAVRWRDPGYGETLLEAIVSEGLADHFAIAVTGDSPPPWSNALSVDSTAHYTDRARPEFDSDGYDHARWFFGSDAELPRWTGYTLGYRFVEAYLLAHPGATAAGLVDAPASAFRPN